MRMMMSDGEGGDETDVCSCAKGAREPALQRVM